MKNQIKRVLFRILAFAFLPCTFAVLFLSCESDTTDSATTNNFLGTWSQTSRTIDGTLSVKDSTRLLIQINSDNICILCDSSAVSIKAKTIVKRSGWSYNAGLFNLAIDMPAAWTVMPSPSTTLVLQRSDFKTNGTVSKTVQTFSRSAHIDIK